MNGQAFYSGTYRTWYAYRDLLVVKSCGSILFRGARRALRANGEKQQVEFKINGVIQRGWKRDGDRLKLAKPLEEGSYRAELQVIYSDLDKPRFQ